MNSFLGRRAGAPNLDNTVIPGRREAASPESITTAVSMWGTAAHHRIDRGYGFRAPRCARPRNDRVVAAKARWPGKARPSASHSISCDGLRIERAEIRRERDHVLERELLDHLLHQRHRAAGTRAVLHIVELAHDIE